MRELHERVYISLEVSHAYNVPHGADREDHVLTMAFSGEKLYVYPIPCMRSEGILNTYLCTVLTGRLLSGSSLVQTRKRLQECEVGESVGRACLGSATRQPRQKAPKWKAGTHVADGVGENRTVATGLPR
jgi:hypothetical protein